MKTIYAADRSFVPASHENPQSPGAWKKVLLQKADFQSGMVQMINWSRLPPGKSFTPHYHEDMQEVFIVLQGEARITVGSQAAVLRRGDTVVIDAREIHEMCNLGQAEVEYLALGISSGQGGRTIVV